MTHGDKLFVAAGCASGVCLCKPEGERSARNSTKKINQEHH